jgi:predicted nucleic acid-binding protein
VNVVDAGVIVALLADDLPPERLGEEELAAPHLLDSEVTNVLRRLVRQGLLNETQGRAALEGFERLTLSRYPTGWLRSRMWELRHDLSAYDATYVALAERIGATALLTTDERLTRAPGLDCVVELV